MILQMEEYQLTGVPLVDKCLVKQETTNVKFVKKTFPSLIWSNQVTPASQVHVIGHLWHCYIQDWSTEKKKTEQKRALYWAWLSHKICLPKTISHLSRFKEILKTINNLLGKDK